MRRALFSFAALSAFATTFGVGGFCRKLPEEPVSVHRDVVDRSADSSSGDFKSGDSDHYAPAVLRRAHVSPGVVVVLADDN